MLNGDFFFHNRSYGHLLGLAGKDAPEDGEGSTAGGPGGRSSAARPGGRSQKHDALPALQPRGDLNVPPRTVDSESKCFVFFN